MQRPVALLGNAFGFAHSESSTLAAYVEPEPTVG
jgi:hypothetical protein